MYGLQTHFLFSFSLFLLPQGAPTWGKREIKKEKKNEMMFASGRTLKEKRTSISSSSVGSFLFFCVPTVDEREDSLAVIFHREDLGLGLNFLFM